MAGGEKLTKAELSALTGRKKPSGVALRSANGEVHYWPYWGRKAGRRLLAETEARE